MLAEYRDLKGILESMFHALQYPRPAIRDGSISIQDRNIGRIIQTQSDSHPLQLCEIFLSDLIQLPKQRLSYDPVIPYPFVERDISFVVSKEIRYSELEDLFNRMEIPALKNWKLVDRSSPPFIS